MSPYWDADFFSFFATFVKRLFSLQIQTLATDEVQLLTLSLIAISCAVLGPFLILKKMAMFANSLAHTILVGIVGACLLLGTGMMFDLSHLLLGALCAAFLTAICTEGLVKYFRLTEDASVGLIFTSLFAAGILLVTMYLRDVHLGIESVMGNADVLSVEDVKTSALLSSINVMAIVLFYRHFQLSSFDRSFAMILGRSGTFFHFLLLFLVAMTCIGAFRAVGALLVLSFLVGPYLTARLFFHRLPKILFVSCGIGVFASFCGVALTRHMFTTFDLPLSTGGMVVTLLGLFYVLGLCVQGLQQSKKRKTLLLKARLCYSQRKPLKKI